jgi:acyl-CoA synthetase (AMP-forming)/AMP-acid ligase II
VISASASVASRHRSLVAALHTAAREGTARDGVVFVQLDEAERFYDWRELLDRAARAAACLGGAGVLPGDRVAMVLPTSVGFLDAFLGALLAGAVPVPLYPPVRLARTREYETSTLRMLRVVAPRAVVFDARVRPVLSPIVARLSASAIDVERLTASGARAAHDVTGDALGLIQFSSGSTVAPKAVALTHAQLLAQCHALDVLVRDRPDNTGVGCSWLPLYHDMGLIGGLLFALTYPGRLVLLSPEHFLARPALWLRAIARHRAFISTAPNFAYAICTRRVRDKDLLGLDLSAWTLALNGSEPVVRETLEAFGARFAKFGFDPRAQMPVYGLAEAGLAVTLAPPGRALRHRRFGGRDVLSVGAPVEGVSVRIVGVDGRAIADGDEGEIEAAGPSIMRGYFGDDAQSRRALRGGWLVTGDRGFIDGGELYVTGRAKDVIIVRGQNHAPQKFEEALLSLEGLRPGCAVALGETFSDGEGLLVIAERAQRDRSDDAALVARIGTRLIAQTAVRPARIVIVAPGTLPRTSSGKLRRAEALARYRAGTLEPVRPSAWTRIVGAVWSRFSRWRAHWQPRALAP